MTRIHPLLPALLIQITTMLGMAALVLSQQIISLTLFEASVLQGLIAAAISYGLRLPSWWSLIHLLFMPVAIVTLSLNISPLWFLTLFILLLLIYGKTFRTQVPLYLSSHKVNDILHTLLPSDKNFTFIDLGSGCGGLLKNLAQTFRNGTFHGIESAPLPFLISKLRNIRFASSCKICWGDFWKHDLSRYDVVYAYLSPVPMTTLWQKAKKEMRPGSLLISNTFMIPGIKPYKSIRLNDFSNSTLHLWKI